MVATLFLKIVSSIIFKVKHPIFLAAGSVNAVILLLVYYYGVPMFWLFLPLGFYSFFRLFSLKENHQAIQKFRLSRMSTIISIMWLIMVAVFYLLSLTKLVLIGSVGLFSFYTFNLGENILNYFSSFNTKHKLIWSGYLLLIISSQVLLVSYIIFQQPVDTYFVLALLVLGFLGAPLVHFYLKNYYQMLEEKNIKQEFYYAKNVSLLNANKILEKKLLALNNEALNNQINPHFLFNAMNSINSLIILQKAEQAEIYLNDLESFLEKTLVKRKTSFYTLKEELDILQGYVKLESLRKGVKVQFTTHVSSHIKPSDLYVPHLFLQSCLENSFWHGFVDIAEPQIHIEITASENLLTLKVKDNGIGITQTLKTKNSNPDHVSAGMSILKHRVKTLEEHYEQYCEFKIEDRKNSNPSENGTVVTIVIPLILEPPLVKLLS